MSAGTAAGAKAPVRRRRWRIAAAAVALAIAGGLGWAAYEIERLGPPPLAARAQMSTLVLDRDGRLLRPFATADGYWRLPVDLADVDPRFVAMLVAYEDRRFREHAGIDPKALARAAWQAASSGRVVSGASTLTMQLARLLEPRTGSKVAAKVREAVRAVSIERRWTKDQILTRYLELAPYGGNLEGVRAASLAYFGKEPKRLSLAEAALLVALPQAPEARRPDRDTAAARRARDRVLDRMIEAGVITAGEAESARDDAVPSSRQPFPMHAPHLAAASITTRKDAGVIRLAVDAALQERLEALARDRVQTLGPRLSVAMVAVKAATGEVIAHVGSPDLLDERRAGHVDMATALRSPGSTLKPFIYALAFADGLAHPDTLIEDKPTRFGTYAPENFDEGYKGTVTVRQALQSSLNVPAVAILAALKPERLYARLRAAGADLELPPNETPGLAIGLGGVGIRLRDLVGLYTAFINKGDVVELTDTPWPEDRTPLRRRFIDPVAAWYVSDILAGAPTPENFAMGRIAFKTGTSYGFRDAWAVGFDGATVIGVWIGRPDGVPIPGLIGRTSAAPLLLDAFSRLATRAPLPSRPDAALVASNSKLPQPLKRFGGGPAPGLIAVGPRVGSTLAIAFPPNGARVDLGAAMGGTPGPLALKAQGGRLPLTWLVNGMPLDSAGHRREAIWQPDGPGFARVSVVDADGSAATATVRID